MDKVVYIKVDVKERLPKESPKYYFVLSKTDMGIACFNRGLKWEISGSLNGEITHWLGEINIPEMTDEDKEDAYLTNNIRAISGFGLFKLGINAYRNWIRNKLKQ